jgi:hypothetical protein
MSLSLLDQREQRREEQEQDIAFNQTNIKHTEGKQRIP